MPDTTETWGFNGEAPMDDAFLKILDSNDDAKYLDITSDLASLETNDSEVRVYQTPHLDAKSNFWHQIGARALRFPKNVMSVLVAAQMDITRISSSNMPSRHIDIAPIMQLYQQQARGMISVSSGLVMSRKQLKSSSLLAPSGALLAWMELVEDGYNDNN